MWQIEVVIDGVSSTHYYANEKEAKEVFCALNLKAMTEVSVSSIEIRMKEVSPRSRNP